MKEFLVSDVLEIYNGRDYSHLQTGKFPLYGSGGLMSYVNSYLYNGEAILLPRKGTLNNIMYVNEKFWTVDTMYYATVNPSFSTYYIFAYLSQLNLKHLDSGSTLPSMTKTAYNNIKIVLPSLNTQKSIAHILSTLDQKIAINNQINAQLEQMAKTLYDYWFVQFDFPDENGKPYKSSGGEMVYNDTLKREIPKGWEICEIQECLDKVPNTTKIPNKEILQNGLYPVIDQSREYICGFTNDDKSVITPKDAHIIFGDHTRIVKLVNFPYSRGADGTQVLISNTIQIPNYLLYQIIKDIDLSSYGYARHFKFLKEQKIIKPIKDISQGYQIIVSLLFEQIKKLQKQNQQLTQLRDFLLPILMNGQVGVGDD